MNHRRDDNPIEAVEPDLTSPVTLDELCSLLQVRTEVVCEWVAEGVVRPRGERLGEWRFEPGELERARRARRLQHDFELGTRSLPLVMDLLGEVQRLRRRLRVFEERYLE